MKPEPCAEEAEFAPELSIIRPGDRLPSWLTIEAIVEFLHENMKPFEDTPSAIQNGVEFALSPEAGRGGCLVLAAQGEEIVGIVVVVNTGLKGCIPENLLLFASVRPSQRGQGIGGTLIQNALAECHGDVKLHVEYDNPALRLYERLGFVNKYAEMRLAK